MSLVLGFYLPFPAKLESCNGRLFISFWYSMLSLMRFRYMSTVYLCFCLDEDRALPGICPSRKEQFDCRVYPTENTPGEAVDST